MRPEGGTLMPHASHKAQQKKLFVMVLAKFLFSSVKKLSRLCFSRLHESRHGCMYWIAIPYHS